MITPAQRGRGEIIGFSVRLLSGFLSDGPSCGLSCSELLSEHKVSFACVAPQASEQVSGCREGFWRYNQDITDPFSSCVMGQQQDNRISSQQNFFLQSTYRGEAKMKPLTSAGPISGAIQSCSFCLKERNLKI